MGYTQAIAFSESVREGSVKLEQAVAYQLTANHYPPVPRSMIKPCIRAIQYANRGKWNSNITLPEGVTWRGKKTAPVAAIIESHHLEPFIDQGEED